ncbi:HNH endonuclease [Aerosakkonema funiforme]|uniref:HNH endonuclease n=1 Tax=Aerosakkonema funiforme TaxID=1246630 RepID=UPI0035BB1005
MSSEQQKVTKNLAYYCKVFSELNVSKSRQRGNALYQPILLLSIIDLISQGLIKENYITVSDDLINTFAKYWNLLASDSSYLGDGLHYPFIHLQSKSFWRVEFKPEFEKGKKISTNKMLRRAVEYAELDEELFNFIQSDSVIALIDALIEAWFTSKRQQVEEILKVNELFQQIDKKDIESLDDPVNSQLNPKVVLKKTVIRNAFFRKAVVHIYDYRCAFCQLKVMRGLSQNIVDGAHIKPFAKFYDSRINNGISFCKNHHWAFDQGWFCIDNNYKIIVASDLQEESPYSQPMQTFHNQKILLPNAEKYFPNIEALEWHRHHIFKA